MRRFLKQSEMERQLDDLGAYYSLPTVSVRRAFFQHAVMAGSSTAKTEVFAPSRMTRDGLHPSGAERC